MLQDRDLRRGCLPEAFLTAVVRRYAAERKIEAEVRPYSVRGGYGRVVKELKQFVRDLEHGRIALPDLLVVGRDANRPLPEAVRDAGATPLSGGIEHAGSAGKRHE